MVKWFYTIWALILHCTRKSLFKRYFVDLSEDDDGNNLPFGPPITSIFFSVGVYVIISNLDFYPEKFRKLNSILMGLYEFVVTSIILDFALSCIWTPIDVHIYTTLTKLISQILLNFEYTNASQWIHANKYPMAILCYIVTLGFLITALYVTKTIDILVNSEYKPRFLSNRLIGIVQNSSGEYFMNFEESESEPVNPKKTRNRKKNRAPKTVNTDL